MTKKNLCILFCVLGMVLLALPAAAQQTNARIFGVITDAEGNPLPGVSVEATSPKMVGKASTISDDTGTFRLLSLAPGEYKLVFTLEGFLTKVQENVSVTVEQTINLKVAMQLGSIQESITVTGAPLIDVKSTVKGATLTREVFSSLPKGRNFDTLVSVIPGVTNEAILNGISVDGSSGGENIFYIDGTDVTNAFGGVRGQDASFEFVDEVQVKASGYSAEFGGSLGGVINVITRSGGNEFHGEAFAYYSGDKLNATERDTVTTDPIATVPTALTFNYTSDRNQKELENRFDLGFGLGGYIVKDKVWFYGNIAPVLRSRTRPSVFLYPEDPAHRAFSMNSWLADLNGGAPYSFETYDYQRADNAYNLQFKVTAQPAKALRLSASFVNNYTYNLGDLPNFNGSSSDVIDWKNAGYKFPNYSANLSADWTLGNDAMLSLRGGYYYSGQLPNGKLEAGNQPLYNFLYNNNFADATEIHAAGWQSILTQQVLNPDYKNVQRHYSLNGDFSYFFSLGGEHALKLGGQFVRVQSDKNTLQTAPLILFYWGQGYGSHGYMEVRGGVDSLDGPYGKQYGDFGNAVSDRIALYVQDAWTIGRRFTLNFGVRAESENVPSFNTDSINWAEFVGKDAIKFPFSKKIAPRLGFTWDVNGDSSLKVYGSYGLFHDVMELDMALGSFGGMRWISSYYAINSANDWRKYGMLQADGTRFYPEHDYMYYVDFRSQSWNSIDPDIKPMSQSEITLGVEKRLSDNLSLSARGVWRKLLRTIDDVGVAVPNDDGEGYNEHYYIANPGYGYTRPISAGGMMSDQNWPCPKATRDYKAVNIELVKRLSGNWMGGVNLTLSRLWGNYTGIVSADESTTGMGRADGNVTRYFDMWWIGYDASGQQKTSEGLLPTDRPIIAKAYGSYHFPFGLTLGAVANWMRGTPITTEFYVDSANGFYPYGRGDLGRTPDLYFVNLSAEYNLKLGKNTLQFNLNIDNASNADAPIFNYRRLNWANRRWSRLVPGGQSAMVSTIKAGFDPLQWEQKTWPYATNKWYRHPLYNKAISFQAPLSARLGVKFIF